MNRNRHFIPTAGSALPHHIRQNSGDSSKTYEETVAIYGFANHAEFDAHSPLIRPKVQNGFIYRGDDLTLGEALKKGLAPQGMRPTWSPEARKRYEICIEPSIKKYRKAIDRINENAWTKYENQTFVYISAAIGPPALEELINGFRGDVSVKARWRWETSAKRGFGYNRVTFWATFIIATGAYIVVRKETLRDEAIAFEVATEDFFEKVSECREKNPYDMWRQLTPAEMRQNIFLESLRPTHPNRGTLYPLIDTKNPFMKNPRK